jgi:DNA-binding PadR family transcriptional regulator
MPGPPRRSPLALVVLAMLFEAPMHPYRMQQLIKERGKDQVVNVRQRASIYQTIERLQRDGLIEVRETERDENWPERTVYQLTPSGRRILMDWLRDMLATPARDFPEFPAALAFLPLLDAGDAAAQLEARAASLEHELGRLQDGIAAMTDFLPRVFVIEDEYRIALLRTELGWVRSLAAELREGRLGWTEEWLRSIADGPPGGGQQPPAADKADGWATPGSRAPGRGRQEPGPRAGRAGGS